MLSTAGNMRVYFPNLIM